VLCWCLVVVARSAVGVRPHPVGVRPFGRSCLLHVVVLVWYSCPYVCGVGARDRGGVRSSNGECHQHHTETLRLSFIMCTHVCTWENDYSYILHFIASGQWGWGGVGQGLLLEQSLGGV
jgi:hypothetical protein